jgi:predicted dehydrogenase
MDAAEGEEMVAAVERAGVLNMVWYNYRRVPAIALARQLIDEGRIGRPYHYRARFLQDWTIAEDVPQGGAALWRLDVDAAGSGVTGDLLAHSIDTAIWLNGPITKVMAETETFVKQRLHQETGKIQPVGIDDACMVMARFANGSMGQFESTRYARGHKAQQTLELNGEAGSLAFDLHDDQWLSFFEYRAPDGRKTESHLAGWRRIHVTSFEHPYMDRWWVPGLSISYAHTFIHAVADFLRGAETATPAEPTFRTALWTQMVCDAILTSAKVGQWIPTGVA